jgi:hypothetical protein
MLLLMIIGNRNEVPLFLHGSGVVCIEFQRLYVIILLLPVPDPIFVIVLKPFIPSPMFLLGFYFLFQDIRCT